MSYCTLFFLLLAFACFSILNLTFHRCNLQVRIWFNQIFLNNKVALPINLPGLAYFDIGLYFLFLYFYHYHISRPKPNCNIEGKRGKSVLGRHFLQKISFTWKNPPTCIHKACAIKGSWIGIPEDKIRALLFICQMLPKRDTGLRIAINW